MASKKNKRSVSVSPAQPAPFYPSQEDRLEALFDTEDAEVGEMVKDLFATRALLNDLGIYL